MGEQPVVLAVASYSSRTAAEMDFDSMWSSESLSTGDHLTAAVVEKGTSGELEITCHRTSAAGFPWGLALLGGALITVAAPVGVSYLASGLSSSAEWAGAAAIVGHFWNHIPREKLRSMSILLEAGQAGLVVVVIADNSENVMRYLSGATSRVVSESTSVDLRADFTRATGEA